MDEKEKYELDSENLEKVSGGKNYPNQYYKDYYWLVMKVLGAAMEHGYRTACCPKCGAPLELLRRRDMDYEEYKVAGTKGQLMCHTCKAVSKPEAWVINKFNS